MPESSEPQKQGYCGIAARRIQKFGTPMQNPLNDALRACLRQISRFRNPNDPLRSPRADRFLTLR